MHCKMSSSVPGLHHLENSKTHTHTHTFTNNKNTNTELLLCSGLTKSNLNSCYVLDARLGSFHRLYPVTIRATPWCVNFTPPPLKYGEDETPKVWMLLTLLELETWLLNCIPNTPSTPQFHFLEREAPGRIDSESGPVFRFVFLFLFQWIFKFIPPPNQERRENQRNKHNPAQNSTHYVGIPQWSILLEGDHFFLSSINPIKISSHTKGNRRQIQKERLWLLPPGWKGS